MTEYGTALSPDVVAERLRALTSHASAFNPFRGFKSSRFFGTVDETGFDLQVNLPYRAPVVIALRGRLAPYDVPMGAASPGRFRTQVSVRAGVTPLSVLAVAGLCTFLGSLRLELGVVSAVLLGLGGAGVAIKETRRGLRTLCEVLQLVPLALARGEDRESTG